MDDYEATNRRWLDSIEVLRQTCERADREFARECERYREWRIRAREEERGKCDD